MPILDYSGTNSGLFTHLGKLIGRINGYTTLGRTSLAADSLALLTAFGVAWLPEEGVAAYYDGLRDQVTGWRVGLAGWADRRLTDRDTVLVPLGLPPGAGVADVLPALRRAMLADGVGLTPCVCAVGSVTADGANVGNGTAYLTLTLDGVSAPAAGASAQPFYDGLASQFCVPSETMVLECLADSVMDGLDEGAEVWSWSGRPDFGDLDVRAEGSGVGPAVATSDAGGNVLTNGGFEDGTTIAPAGWTQEASGVVQLSTTTPRRGAKCGMFPSAATGRVSQSLATGQPRRRYFVGFSARSTGGDDLVVTVTGTTGTPGSLTVTPGGSWASHGFFVTFPAPIPSDWRITLEVVGTSGNVFVDDVTVAPIDYHGGVGLAVQAGVTPWHRGDRLTWSVTNDGAGKFADFFRRWYRFQLPSSGTLVSESLAS